MENKESRHGRVTAQLLCLLHPCHLIFPAGLIRDIPPRDLQKVYLKGSPQSA